MSPYDELGVDPGASPAEIRSAYLRLARASHPDRLVDADPAARQEAEERMRRINEAWRQLSTGAIDQGAVSRPDTSRPEGWHVGEEADRDDDDPIELDDEGLPPPRGARVLIAAAPILLVFGLVTVFFGGILGLRGLLAGGAAVMAVSVALFAAAPLLVMSAGRRDG